MNKSFKHLPQNERKKILLICDDIRVHSGVATVAKEMVINTCQHFNWVQVAGAIKHPEAGKRFDLSADTNREAELEDSSVILYPTDGYGNPDLIRQLIKIEKPDAIFIITDPRYFTWLFNMESEIRKVMPIIYLNIWDDYPAPLYNKAYYESCDALLAISKQTKNINEIVLGDKAEDKVIKYVPHGLNTKYYFPLDKSSKEVQDIKKQVFGDDEVDFVMFFNSRNIRRKQIPDTMLAFKLFLDSLPKEKAEKCRFLLHTEMVHEAGTDLGVINELLFSKDYPNAISFSTNKLPTATLNLLYNLADVQILLTSNEGWGLTLTESLLVGNPIIANVTGGMQDQMRFEDEKGKWIDFTPEFPSNHRGTYKKHGEWAFPVYPTSRSCQGSIPTPYIFDDRCAWEDATKRIKEIYNFTPEERKVKGLKGREWAISKEAGFTCKHQANRVMEAFTELFDTWKPREKYELVNTTKFIGRTLKHKLIY